MESEIGSANVMMQPNDPPSPSPESIAASCVFASARASGRPPESTPSTIQAATDGSDPIALKNGVSAGPRNAPIEGAAHMMPTMLIESGPIAPSPFSNSSP